MYVQFDNNEFVRVFVKCYCFSENVLCLQRFCVFGFASRLNISFLATFCRRSENGGQLPRRLCVALDQSNR